MGGQPPGIGGETLEEAIERREESWDRTVSRHFLEVFRLKAAQLLPYGGLSVAAIHKALPSFPLAFTATRIPHPETLMELIFDARFNRDGASKSKFTKGRFYKAYTESKEYAETLGRSNAGCVFYHQNVQSMIIHDLNLQVLSARDTDAAWIIVEVGKGQRLVIEPFRQLLRRIEGHKGYYDFEGDIRRISPPAQD